MIVDCRSATVVVNVLLVKCKEESEVGKRGNTALLPGRLFFDSLTQPSSQQLLSTVISADR